MKEKKKKVEVLRGDSKVFNLFVFRVGDNFVWYWHQKWAIEGKREIEGVRFLAESLYDWRESSPLELLLHTGMSVREVLEYESKSF
jgi:hypothetical protein